MFSKVKVLSWRLQKCPTSIRIPILLNNKKIEDDVFKIQVLQVSYKWTFPYKIVLIRLQIECFSRAAIECLWLLLFPSCFAAARTRGTAAHKSLSNYRAAVGPRSSSPAIAVRR